MKPGSPEWARLVTASKVAAILGLSPWDSQRTVWHRMRGDVPWDDNGNAEAKSRGHYLEDGVIRWWLDQHPGATGDQQRTFLLDDWGAATPDLSGTDEHGRRFVMDAKTAASDDDWTDEDGAFAAPPYYLAQSVWQLACDPDAEVAYIAALTGPRLRLRETPPVLRSEHEALIAEVVAQAREFYDSLTGDVPPHLSGVPAEYEVLRRVHPEIDRDAVVEIPRDVALALLTAKEGEKRLRAEQAAVLDLMGRARIATCGGVKVARRQPSQGAIALYTTATPDDLKEPA